jgi:prevent-host-death family protein
MIENRWQLQEAKNKFSSLVEKAQHSGPQVVTRHGRNVVVVLAMDEYRKLIKPEVGLVKFLQSSPLADTDLELPRCKDRPREIVL